MRVGVPKERYPGERRVALVPASVPVLVKGGCEVVVEAGAGAGAFISDAAYVEKGARIETDRAAIFASCDAILQVLGPGANDRNGDEDLALLRPGQLLIGFLRPLDPGGVAARIAASGAVAHAVELIPRTTRAQAMDVLSAMATIWGYKAVLLAAETLPRMFPMLMTAAGTITPARVFVIGAGVAGLQAIATAKRLGAVVSAYDVRPATKDQVVSVGGKFVELPLESGDSQDAGGYARAQDESFYRRQRELLGRVVRESDVVITTAVVPGKTAPVLISADMVRAMQPGSVIVDLAAERGGNCELTRMGEEVVDGGVTIFGLVNLASTVPFHASLLYSRTATTFLLHLLEEAKKAEGEDEIARDTRVTKGGEVVNARVRQAAAG